MRGPGGRRRATVDEWSVQYPTGRSVRMKELDEDAVHEWTDGSRIGGRAAGATRGEGLYLGTMATAADAEEAGVALAWERCDTVQRLWTAKE